MVYELENFKEIFYIGCEDAAKFCKTSVFRFNQIIRNSYNRKSLDNVIIRRCLNYMLNLVKCAQNQEQVRMQFSKFMRKKNINDFMQEYDLIRIFSHDKKERC